MLADSAVVVEELWWQAIDYARLNHSMILFFNFSKRETAASCWSLVRLNASKVGKGLSKDSKAQKLAFQHWIEAHLVKDDFILSYAEEGAFSEAQRGGGEEKGLASNRSFKTCWFTNPTHTHTPKIDSECSFF
ncbi:hypothetical protein ACSBR1_016328 [Camellia fascicularis]